MKWKKLGIIAGVAFVIFFLVSQPGTSAGMIKDSLSGVGHIADKLALFVKSLTT